ncbi:DUF378 domain-containing protein [Virgibacillus phasianinus]|uniref:DUF378 domain-containing protein n=1 Tax=Virgibacillus phasianinus TaxID=2017483 RepID=A0A220TYJ6_9BACI|nr:DUF378 domain-containing protein [Virgibacillus phasianinus]ASK60743.1 DUF378 domain-containing protein [Virgibacillus phasianinus]
MTTLKRIALTLVIIGAVNWGLIGFFQFDLVSAIFGGQDAALSRVIYSLVGISGLFCLAILFDPMTDTDEDTGSGTVRTNNVNYGTEFSEETDLTRVKEDNPEDKNE